MSDINFLPLPELNSERLHLRRLLFEDDEAILQLRDHEEVLKYIDRPKVISQGGARDFIRYINEGTNKQKWFYWGITPAGRDQVVGTVCLWNFNARKTKAELGYELHPDFQGRGLMREAVKAVLHFGFDTLRLKQVLAHTHVENIRSARLLESLGFSYEKRSGDFSIHRLRRSAFGPSR